MTGKQVNRYLDLVKRRLYILNYSGTDWKLEYTEELKQIEQELGQLQPIVEQARKERGNDGKETESL